MRAAGWSPRRTKTLGLGSALLVCLMVLPGCGRKVAELENKVAQLEQERDELQQFVSDQDAHAIEIGNAVDDVLSRVTEITARQGRLRVEAHEAEMGSSGDITAVRESILEEINWLNGELDDNRQRLAELTEQVASLEGAGARAATRIAQLEKMIDTQELLIKDLRLDAERLEQRAALLMAEKTQVEEEKAETEEELDQLAAEHRDLRTQYDELEGDVGRGWVLVGDKKRIKELRKADVLQERGKVVVAGTLLSSPAEFFRGVSVVSREIRLGPVSERLEVLSPHREQGETYWFERRGDDVYLMLRDPGRFWSASHYLVIRER